MTLKKGQYVRHEKYGWGTVVEHDSEQTTVYFRNVGVKRLPNSLAAFAMVEGAAPKKKSMAAN